MPLVSEKEELLALKREIDRKLKGVFPPTSPLFEAVNYALESGGKRIRPLLVFLIGEALGFGLDVTESALALEFFHTASLIADDLPCMDNDDYRREMPSLHKKFNETTALLASYGLICEGFRRIEMCGQAMRLHPHFKERAFEAIAIGLECASRCSGLEGAVLGQYLDLFPRSESPSAIQETIYLKTVTLFEGAFVLGWVFGGGSFEALPLVKEAAYHFGFAFQLRDDFHDLLQDLKKENPANLALSLGEEKAREVFFSEVEKLNASLEALSLKTPKLAFLLHSLFELELIQTSLHTF